MSLANTMADSAEALTACCSAAVGRIRHYGFEIDNLETPMSAYDPEAYRGLTFHDRLSAFREGKDSPRAYLDRCLAVVAEHEPVVQAFAHLNEASAIAAADASTARWREGKPLSPIDGMPVGIKDLLETSDMPTEMNCAGLKGNFPKRDNAAVSALRNAGAVIFGKTVTAELGGAHPGPTTNPFDRTRTPGGSSSGSAAAVAAGMMPAAIGTQVGGSIIRPAGYCGNIALKPSQGGINRGERMATSMSTHGVHANCFEDMWQVTMEIVARVGGDRGGPGVIGPMTPPPATKPATLIVLETAGWAGLDEGSKSVFSALLDQIESAGVTLLRRSEVREVERLEQSIAEAGRICAAITAWENQWGTRNLLDAYGPERISQRAQKILKNAEAMSVRDYRDVLLDREIAQRVHAAIAPIADAAISLSCPGPAPVWNGYKPGEPLIGRPTGDAVFNYPSSMLFAPVVTTPMMRVAGMPVGLQTLGQPGQDAKIAGISRWIYDTIQPVSV
jgi:Asp-tRNA(Asn)/Glu-tRNA(Gln) amidotransferase A subunit family amidase